MSNLKKIAEMLKNGETVYIKDEFYEMALRIYKDDNGTERTYRKFRNNHAIPEEWPIDPRKDDTAFDVEMGGEFITKEEYDEFDKGDPVYQRKNE